jgi:hypothetical protein
MSTKGRHSGEGGNCFRDLGIMIGGILGVGALVFLILFFFVGDTSEEPDAFGTTTTTTTTTAPVDGSSTSIDTTSTTTPTTNTSVPIRAPEDVRVVALNSVGIAGAAGRFTAKLTEQGYQTLQAVDYRPEQNPTRIWYREGFSAEANAIASFMLDDSGTQTLVEGLPDDTLEPGADIVVVLGTGYQE